MTGGNVPSIEADQGRSPIPKTYVEGIKALGSLAGVDAAAYLYGIGGFLTLATFATRLNVLGSGVIALRPEEFVAVLVFSSVLIVLAMIAQMTVYRATLEATRADIQHRIAADERLAALGRAAAEEAKGPIHPPAWPNQGAAPGPMSAGAPLEPGGGSIAEELAKFARLHDEGHLTMAEFSAAKKRILTP